MKLEGYYSSGEFARMAGVSVRTIRFYDKQNILKPSYVNDSGARFYTDRDLARLQQILLLKYLGFSLEDIREMLIDDPDERYLMHSLQLQKKLVQDRIEQMQLVEQAIESTVSALKEDHRVDWSHMLELIHLTGMEKSLKTQYLDAGNISARIRLHRDYSKNPEGWFPWIYDQCGIYSGMKILEIGCGDGALWTENRRKLPEDVEILLSDASDGMLRDARRNIGAGDSRFSWQVFPAHRIHAEDASVDLVIANHVLFYCEDIPQVSREICRILKPGGVFVCSTYGRNHMREVTELARGFDSRVMLSGEKLYEKFGLENGAEILRRFFEMVECRRYEDAILIDEAEPLIDYIMSCHGNQKELLLDRYQEFREYAETAVKNGFYITKEAGVFVCGSPVSETAVL
ncbi:MAG: MerR family transcriptional regulator [Clostridiales bacterium]|nr:MerR family transcriptional regulator [Clostridiales bacterium]MCD8132342.1 MerR family transcriptional regulator [Clostridiales bacterium]